MAEAFGIFAGAAGLAGLFTNCVRCFEYVQFGRKFGKDYETCLVKLDIVRLRLSRWGVSVGLVAEPAEPRRSTIVPQIAVSNSEVELVETILGQIVDAFDEVRAMSIKFKMKVQNSNSADLLLCDPNTDLEPRFRDLHLKTRNTALRRQKGTTFVQKAAWALYEKKKFDRLIEDVTGFMDTLERAFPGTRERQEALCIQETSEIGGTDGLKLLGDIAGKHDTLLTEAVTKTLLNVRLQALQLLLCRFYL
jgi:hypothetical protein